LHRGTATRRPRLMATAVLAWLASLPSEGSENLAYFLFGPAVDLRDNGVRDRKALKLFGAQPQQVEAKPIDLRVTAIPRAPAILQEAAGSLLQSPENSSKTTIPPSTGKGRTSVLFRNVLNCHSA